MKYQSRIKLNSRIKSCRILLKQINSGKQKIEQFISNKKMEDILNNTAKIVNQLQ